MPITQSQDLPRHSPKPLWDTHRGKQDWECGEGSPQPQLRTLNPSPPTTPPPSVSRGAGLVLGGGSEQVRPLRTKQSLMCRRCPLSLLRVIRSFLTAAITNYHILVASNHTLSFSQSPGGQQSETGFPGLRSGCRRGCVPCRGSGEASGPGLPQLLGAACVWGPAAPPPQSSEPITAPALPPARLADSPPASLS